ncbi:MAG TPA: ATP-binding protein [Acidobacteriaceae bacterium]|nr:ATP-binding protein [Acidobacteriaceae bacterium]
MRFPSLFFPTDRKRAMYSTLAMIAAIAFIDSRASRDLPLSFLYAFPMLAAGGAFNKAGIVAMAAACTFLSELFDQFPWGPNTGIPRDALYFSAFCCTGLFVYEVTRNRKVAAKHMQIVEAEMAARRDAEEQLQILVESSPAAIFTADAESRILLANDAAHRLFGVPPGELPGLAVYDFLPSLLNVRPRGGSHQPFRTAMQCQGRTADGEIFQADVWFSTYLTSAGPRLAGMVLDTSEDLRTREEASLHQLSLGSRILVAAVSHEIRNVCGSIALVHENLSRSGSLAGNKDFEALGTLVLALERIAAMDLRQTTTHATAIDAGALLEELRIIIEPSLREAGISVLWQIPKSLPHVWADRQSLMQVFLNLTKNSERAMQSTEKKNMTIAAQRESFGAAIRFTDSGGGVAYPERLFHPFQREAHATGLGLYLSRAFMRSFRGDLRYEAMEGGSIFSVELSLALQESEDKNYAKPNPDTAGRRP